MAARKKAPAMNISTCDLCGTARSIFILCPERAVRMCAHHLVKPGRLGGGDHPMPGEDTICAHRGPGSTAARLSGQTTCLYYPKGAR